jgi:hypothetical protein
MYLDSSIFPVSANTVIEIPVYTDRIASIIAIHGHQTISLIWVECMKGPVHWYLLIVDAQTMAMSIWIGEQA